MNKYVKSIIALTAICAAVALLLSATNMLTAPIIEKNESAAANEALLVVMPEGEDFTLMDISSYTLPETVTEVYAESTGGYVVKLTTAGYSTGMVIMCGVDATGTVTGATCLASNETLGAEKTYGEKTVGKTVADIDTVDTVASMTKTTEAYRNAVKDALNAAVILGGGSVDLRSEEEILKDNLSAVLPAAEGAFTPWFMVEELEGVSAVYVADNGSGVVFRKGEEFVLDEALSAVVVGSKTEEMDTSAYELHSSVTKVEKSSGGNYVVEIKASGFGINGDKYYDPSGEPILLRASVTPAGKIIACETLQQSETEGIGSACADPSFYTQFNGKDETNYKEIDAISGATLTTNGYKTAVGRIFETVKILEGVA
ncbi:MAG: FMN-binding protein [Clostridia bacterium]|nr:FMN-binding protein [Clostridia bacterium]